MPRGTPFHDRTSALCHSYRWKEWAGYHAVCSYDVTHDREYNAIRQAAALIDVTGLYKYDIIGPDAAAFLSRVTVRDVGKLRDGRVTYLCWCDDDGKIIDDGTCARLGNDHYRLTAAEPTYYWLAQLSHRYDVEIRDVSEEICTLALQGPRSREVLLAAGVGAARKLRFFGVADAKIDGRQVWVSRTGYTGDLGYEVWVRNEDALAVWDALTAAGAPHGLEPCGLDAMDVARVEAGFVMLGVDFDSAPRCTVPQHASTPYELGFDWLVELNRAPFIGQRALQREAEAGPAVRLVGLEISWPAVEALYEAHGLPPSLPARTDRTPIPVYCRGEQVGRATSRTWSPLLKKYIALATIRTDLSVVGARLEIEHTVDWVRETVDATVVPLPFYDPPQKKETP